MKYFLLFFVSIGAYASLETFNKGEPISASNVNTVIKQVEAQEICYVEGAITSHLVMNITPGVYYNRKFSRMYGDCDFVTKGTVSSDRFYFRKKSFDEVHLVKGEYLVEYSLTGTYYGQHQQGAIYLDGSEEGLSTPVYSAFSNQWGDLMPLMKGIDIISVAGESGVLVLKSKYSNGGTQTIHAVLEKNNSGDTYSVISKLKITRRK